MSPSLNGPLNLTAVSEGTAAVYSWGLSSGVERAAVNGMVGSSNLSGLATKKPVGVSLVGSLAQLDGRGTCYFTRHESADALYMHPYDPRDGTAVPLFTAGALSVCCGNSAVECLSEKQEVVDSISTRSTIPQQQRRQQRQS